MLAKFRPLIKKLGNALVAFILLVSWASPAHAIILFTDELFTNESPAYQIGTTKNAAIDPITLYFGDTNSQTITWDTAKFNISGTAAIAGGVSATGQANFSASTGFRIREVANPATASCATVGELVLNTSNNQIYACAIIGSPGTWTSTASAAQDLESVYNTDADKILTTANSAFTVNTGTNDFIVTSNDWGVSAAGLLTASGGATISGGAVNVNANANQATNINTGTSTGLVSVGGGSGTAAINTTSWDVSSAGVASGLTGLASTGQVNFSGANGTRIREVANQLVASCATVGELVLNTTDSKIYACTVIGTPGTWSNTGSAITPDFEGVYAQDADKILTTSNGAFTIATGTGAVNVNSTTGGINLNNNVNGDVNIATGTSTGTVTLGGTGAQTIAVGSGAGAKTVNLGSSITTSTTNILSGSGAVNVNASNNQPTNIGTGTSTGLVSIGGGSGTVAIDTTSWDISSAGVASGLTGVTSTGTVNFSGTGAFRTREVAGIVNPGTACATVGELIMDTNTQVLYACTNAGTDAWQKVGTGSDAGTLGGLTSSQFLRSDANSALTTGNTLTINGGATLSVAGTFTATGGGSISGAPINLNASSNFATNIGTGTSTGTVSIGNSLASIGMASSTWNISTAGVGSGFTGFTSTGAVNFGGATSFFIPQGAANPGTCAVGQQFYNTTSNLLMLCNAVNTWIVAGPQNFEDVYSYDADKVLTTTNGAFTIAAGTGAVNVNSTTGGISLNNNVNGDVSIATGTSTGTVTVGGTGAQTIAVGSGAGAKTVNVGSSITTSTTTLLSGSGGILINDANNQPTTINGGTSSGTVSIASGAGTQTVLLGDGATGVKTVTMGSTNTTSTTNILSGSGAVNVNVSNNQPTNIGTGTTTGTVTVGGTGTQTIAVGNGAGAKTVALGSSNTTSTTTILSGSGAVNVNVSNNQISNINTGTSTGQVNVGGNANCVNVDSNTWNISCAGLATGFTGMTSTGNINLTGATSFRVPQAAADPGTCNVGQEYFNTTSGTVRLCTSTNTWSNIAASGNAFVFAYDTTTQTTAVAGTFQDITYSTNAQIDGWAHAGGTATFVSTSTGTYMVNVTARIAKNGGANTTLSFIGVKNTIAVPGTFTEISGSQTYGSLSASTGDTMSGNFIVTMAAGETLKIQMTGGTTGAQILPGGNGTTLPSTQLSIWRMK